jgi:hypothetical protein
MVSGCQQCGAIGGENGEITAEPVDGGVSVLVDRSRDAKTNSESPGLAVGGFSASRSSRDGRRLLNRLQMGPGGIDLSVIIEPNTGVAYHDLAEGGVLLNVESGEYFSLNQVGREIWRLISGPTKLSDIVDQLADSVNEPPDSFEIEVRSFIESLLDQELLRVVD